MNAIEFEAQEKNGIIEVPEQYKSLLTRKFRVIILIEEIEPIRKTKKKAKFSAVKIKTKGFKFN